MYSCLPKTWLYTILIISKDLGINVMHNVSLGSAPSVKAGSHWAGFLPGNRNAVQSEHLNEV